MSAYSDLILSKSPLVYYRFDEATPGTGTAADSSGNGRNGTYAGSPSSTAGLIKDGNAAVDINGGKWITSTYNPFAINTSLTFEIWINRFNQVGADTLWGSDAASSMVIFRLNSASDTLQFFPANAGSVSWTSTGIVVGSVYHVVLAWNGTTDAAQLYLNGADLTSKSVGSDFNASPGNLSVGVRATNTESFNGVVDEFAIYSGILSGASILENYNAGIAAQNLRPDADIATTGWATAPLFSKINEASADGTVITATAV